VRHWRPLPTTGLLIDFETSGFETSADVVLQVHVGTMVNRQIVHSETVLLNWVGAGLLEGEWLKNRINNTAAHMLFGGSEFKIDYYDLLHKGVHPVEYLTSLYHRISQHVLAGGWVIGHNYMDFDHRFLVEHLANFCRIYDFNWVGRIFDTGGFEVARQLGIMPEPGETVTNWLWRCRCARSRTKWSLHKHCADLFQLWQRSGVNPTAAHDAGADGLLLFHLLEAYWELLNG